MKALIATPLYPPDSGGPAMEAFQLKNELPKLGIEVDVYSFGAVKHLPSGLRHLIYFLGLLRRVRGVDFIIAIDTFSVCVPASFLALIARKKFVVRVPGEFLWEQAVQRLGITDDIETFQTKRYGRKIEFIRAIEHWAVCRANLVVTCSDFLKGVLRGWGIEKDRLIRIYLGIEQSEPSVPPKEIPNGKIIFSLGRFVPWKGFSMLLDLIQELPEEWKLVIAGDGPMRSSLEQQAQSMNIKHRVVFTGSLKHNEVLGWYETANVFAYNTSFESFSYQILEAMTRGISIVTTNAGSIPELIENGVEGVLCKINDKEAFKEAILSTDNDPEVWKKRNLAAKHKSEFFTVERSIKEFALELKKLQ